MNIRTPTVRLRGKDWMVRWGGKDHYLSRDEATARRLFDDPRSIHPGALHRWQDWARLRLANSPQARVRRQRRRHTLQDAADLLFDHYLSHGREQTARAWRTGLGRFMRWHGSADLIEFATPDVKRHRFAPPVIAMLNAMVSDLKAVKPEERLKNKSINHDVLAVKRLFNFAAEQGLCPAVVWSGVKMLPTRRGRPESRPVEDLVASIISAGNSAECQVPSAKGATSASALSPNPDLVPWLALNYLCVLRPSEVVTLVRGHFDFEPIRNERGKIIHERSLLRLQRHKTLWRGENYDRFVLLTPEASAWLSIARPAWSNLSAYSKAAVAAGFVGGPHVLRDSAASHLRARGVGLEDVKIVLGHSLPGEWKSYAEVPWHDLLQKLGRISLRSAPAPSPGLPTLADPGAWAARIRARGPLHRPKRRARLE